MGKTRKFDDKCEFRYDEDRTGQTKHGHKEHTLYNRCILQKAGDRKCVFSSSTHFDCPVSIHKKHKIKSGTKKYRGKWKKT